MESSKSYQCKKIKVSQIHTNPNNLHDIPKCSWEAEKSFQLSLIEKVIKEGTDKKCNESITESCWAIITILCKFLSLCDIYSHFLKFIFIEG